MFRPADLSNHNNEDKGCMDYVKEYWAKVPFYNRILLFLLPSLYLLSWVFPLDVLAVNKLEYTVYDLQLWRIFTAPYVHPNILMLFFVLLAYIPTGCIREKTIGTVKIIVGFWIMNFFIQLLYLLLWYILHFITSYWVLFYSIGKY